MNHPMSLLTPALISFNTGAKPVVLLYTITAMNSIATNSIVPITCSTFVSIPDSPKKENRKRVKKFIGV
jgi:hypothetical protein